MDRLGLQRCAWKKSHRKLGRTWPQQAMRRGTCPKQMQLTYRDGQLGTSWEYFLEEVGLVDKCGQTKENREGLCCLECLARPAHSYLYSTVT